jgi:N-acetylneuraminate synthase|tara:strand:- start:456 stop:1274 length:819 start_codon:yes stop_codon:yes gene_type:complete
MKTKIIGEIGINHNGDINIAKKLIDVASIAGCDYVKFQKRNPDVCVPEEQKNKMRETPWGEMTYLEYKHRMEFEHEEYDELFKYAESKKIGIFASVWDKDSVDFMKRYTDIMKVPSALITNDDLVFYTRDNSNYMMISTGMSDEEEIEHAVKVGDPDLIFHTNSAYPSPVSDLNLNYIKWLNEKYPTKEIGYSGHEFGLVTTYAAVVMGASWVERHITLERTMWGSDHMASVEPHGLIKLVKDIRSIEDSMGVKESRSVFDSELSKRETLRG